MVARAAAFLVLVFTSVAIDLSRADPAPGPAGVVPSYSEAISVHRVRWPVLVRPLRGVPESACAELKPTDVLVREGDRPVRVAAVDRQDATLYAIVVDVSPSMDERLEAIRAAIRSFARDLAAHDQVMLLTFDRDLMVRAAPTRDYAVLDRAVTSLGPGDQVSTSVHDSLFELLDYLDPHPERKAVVLITDAEDTSSRAHTAREVVRRAARSRDLRVFSLVTAGHEDFQATAPMRWLALSTGGRFDLVPDERDLGRALDDLRDRLASEMVLTYAPPRRDTPGPPGQKARREPEKVRVTVRARPGLPCRVTGAVADRLLVQEEP